MITGNTALLAFNDFFAKEYAYLLGYALLRKADYPEDLLHNAYLKCYKRIMLSGFSGQTFLNFIRVTITNANTNTYRDKKNNVEFLSTSEQAPLGLDEGDVAGQYNKQNFSEEIEQKLLQKDEDERIEADRQYDINFRHTMAFEYVNKYFNERDKMVFKTYYVLKYKHLNYKQLAKACNMSQSTVSNIIKHIKKELKENLRCYIECNMNCMELEEKVSKVEALLQKDLRHNLGEYKSYYLLIFGKSWSGCGCNLNQIRESLKSWVIKNKALLVEKNKIII